MRLHRRLQVLRGPLDMAPLAGVVLLLLVFFMLSPAFILQPGIRVDPPRSLYGSGLAGRRLIITLMPDPRQAGAGAPKTLIFFNDRIMTLAELQAALAAVPHGPNAPPLVVKSDKDVPLGLVVDIMNAAMAQGLSVMIGTQASDGLSSS